MTEELRSLFSAVPDPIVDGGCDGSSACQAKVHVHGCFADTGNCDSPAEYHGEPYDFAAHCEGYS